MVTQNKRKEKDVMKLLVSEYDVQCVNDVTNNEFIVKFIGPKDSNYEGVSTKHHITFKFEEFFVRAPRPLTPCD